LTNLSACGTTSVTQSGLTIGTTYYVRVANLNSNPSGTGGVADFNICVTHTPPANDECAGAISLTSNSVCSNTSGTLVGASASTIAAIGCGVANRNDVWYSFVAVGANTTITLSSAPANPRIQLFSGSCASLTSVACASGLSLVSTTLTPGTTYYVRIYTDPSTASASNTFNICVTHTAPSNDECANAISLTSNTGCINTTGSLNLATPSASIPLGCGAAGTYYDVWYSFVAVATTQIVTLSNLGASITAPQLQIYTNACAALGAPICGNTTITQTGLTIGTTYKVRVSNFNADPSGTGTASSFNICVTHAGLANDQCGAATLLTSGTSCVNTAGTLVGATYTAVTDCNSYNNVDAWYSFVAQSPNPTITMSSASNTRARIQLFSGSCGSLTCITGTTSNGATQTINATCLTLGTTYYIRATSSTGVTYTYNICVTDPAANSAPSNDNCSGAINLTPGTTCVNTAGTLAGATVSSPSVSSTCTGTPGADVWYSFTATSPFSTITLSSVGTNICTPYIQLFSGSCGTLTEITCTSGTSLLPGGTGLTVGAIYYVRIYSPNTYTPGTGWGFNICITTPGTGSSATVDYSKSYVNITKLATGGGVEPGDILEIRATFVVRSGSVDSLAFFDTLQSNSGFTLLSASIAERTNEGKIYRRDSPTKSEFTDATGDDAGWYTVNGSDTIIRINIGIGASANARGLLANNSRPSVYGGTCIIMATYRVQVYAGYEQKINWGGGAFTYRDGSNGMRTASFKNDSLVVYVSPGLCSGSLSSNNFVNIESAGTFGAPATGAPLARNRGTSTAIPSYVYRIFATGSGPNDYYYGVPNNTSATYSTINTLAKSTLGSSIPQRVFSHWDIIGDHTGATNTAKGNAPCDTTLPVSSTNPCGYMLVVNAAYKTDTAFRATITNLCPNTYYEISAWVRNVCYKCGCDSTGKGAANANVATPPAYIPFATNDSSGVPPNLAFQINGQDYYQTGNIYYTGTGPGITQQASDSVNAWVNRGFVYKTGPTETGFELVIRNNAPGGGGNDWAIDDIALRTCNPTMTYNPSLAPTVCENNQIIITDTVRSYFDNYIYYIWQVSTDGGTNWTDVSGTGGTASPVWNGSAWEFVSSYTLPPAATTAANDGDLYRLVVATTAGNLSSSSCISTDPVSVSIDILTNCGPPLKTDILSISGKLIDDKARILWTTSKEDEPVYYELERSSNGLDFKFVARINGNNNLATETNHYSYDDPTPVNGKVYYRIISVAASNAKKYSRIVQVKLTNNGFVFGSVVNPFYKELEYEINSPEAGVAKVQLIDQYGKVVKSESQRIYSGTNALTMFNTDRLPAGVYILKASLNESMIVYRVLKENR
jgi:trimeric autotransporter adhesin